MILTLATVGCQPEIGSPGTSPAVSPPATATGDGPEALVADLQAAGVAARLGDRFVGDPIANLGVIMCVGPEPVHLYVFPSVQERVAAAAKIDPHDPWNVGTAVVEWIGRPRFWQRDRLLILYLGEDAATEATLRTVLGEPFASGEGRSPLRDDTCH